MRTNSSSQALISGKRGAITPELFVELLDQVYATTHHPESWLGLFEVLERRLGAVSALYDRPEHNPLTHRSYIGNLDPSFQVSYNEYYHSTNVWAANRHIYSEQVALCQKIVEVSVLEKTEFYSDWLRPQGYKHSLTCNVRTESDRTVNLGLVRESRLGEFTESEANLLVRLSPHLQRAAEINYRLHKAEASALASGVTLDGMNAAVLLVDAAGRIVFANEGAERVLAAGDGLYARSGRLSARAPAVERRLRAALESATGGGRRLAGRSGDTLTVPRRGLGGSYAVAVSPLAGSEARSHLLSPLALVLLSDPERELGLSAEALRERYGLTAAESRLACALCAGATVASHAEETGTSSTTAKTHLAQIFAKVGENRQSDLVRRLVSDPVLRANTGTRSRSVRGRS